MDATQKHNYEHWIETFGGHPIDPLKPEPCRIWRHDIAHALSNQCRFSGHTTEFYSVAQHSVLVSRLVGTWTDCVKTRFLALYHDASEAYLQDMPTPIKRQMPEYRAAEERLQTMIEATLFPEFAGDGAWKREADRLVKKADLILLATEARDLMNDPKDWKVLQGVTPLPQNVTPLCPKESKKLFLACHADLDFFLDTRKA